MSKADKADEIAAKAARMSARRSAAPEEQATRPRPTAAPVRVKPVRRTVDLAPEQHKGLSRWCDEAAEDLGVTRVTGQDVLTHLVARLLVDEQLGREVREDLADELHRRRA